MRSSVEDSEKQTTFLIAFKSAMKVYNGRLFCRINFDKRLNLFF